MAHPLKHLQRQRTFDGIQQKPKNYFGKKLVETNYQVFDLSDNILLRIILSISIVIRPSWLLNWMEAIITRRIK